MLLDAAGGCWRLLEADKTLSYLLHFVSVINDAPMYCIEDSVADGKKSPKIIVRKSPGSNIENPGDPSVTLLAVLSELSLC